MTTELDAIPTFKQFLDESCKRKDKSNHLNEGEGGGMAAGGMAAGGEGGIAAGDASAEPSSDGDAQFMHGGKPITTVDVLGKFDKKKGCMGPGDFHLPKMVLPLQRRWPCCNGGSKRKKKGKYPKVAKVITSYAELTEDEKQSLKPTLVYNLPQDKISAILDKTAIENPRFSKQQFMKFISNGPSDSVEYVGLFSKFPQECFAMAVLSFGLFSEDDCYVCEIQSFKRGFGKELLLKLLKYQKHLWLMSNIEGGKSLLKFYRDPAFGFTEHILKDSCYGCDAHFFCTKACDEAKLLKHIEETYAAKPDVEKVKIWVDDVRPTPSGYKTIQSVNEFIDWFNENGRDAIEVLDLDHDAGQFQGDGGDYIKILDFLEFSGVKDLKVRIHSDNPVGRQNMQRIIKKNGWTETFDLMESEELNEGVEWFTPVGNYKTDGGKFSCKFPPLDAKTAKRLTGLDMVEFDGDLNGVKSCVGCREGGRSYAVVNDNGIYIPFYVSSGDGDKEKVPTGHWYPFFGKGPDGWLNKGSQEDILSYYGSKKLKAIAQTLDSKLNMNTLKKFDPEKGTYLAGFPYCIASSSDLQSTYNRDVNPVAARDPSRSWKKNIDNLLMAIGEFSLYESKNKITKNPEVIKQKQLPLKVTTTEKAKKIERKTTVPAADKVPTKIPQSISKKVVMPRVVSNDLRSRESRMRPKSTKRISSLKAFQKPVLKIKSISFPKDEVTRELREREVLITTRVDDDYSKYQIGDIVRAPWKDLYRVASRRNISDVIQHPYFRQLTDKQVKLLRQYDKMAVLTLQKQLPVNEDNYDPPYTLQQIRDHYDEDTYKMLASDPVHRWRAETGIELIHREPTWQELERIWKNWQLMSDEEKRASDAKSIELFGVDNETHYYRLQDQFSDLDRDKISSEDFQQWHEVSKWQ